MKGSAATLLLPLLLLMLVAAATANSDPGPNCRPTGKYLVENPRDCRSYFYCFDGQSFYGQCSDGFRFDAARQSCLPATVRECYACPAHGAGNMPHPAACDKFVLCFLGVAHERSCPPGLLFNSHLAQCDLEAKVHCNKRN